MTGPSLAGKTHREARNKIKAVRPQPDAEGCLDFVRSEAYLFRQERRPQTRTNHLISKAYYSIFR
jgi:hypothetical protein